MPLRVPEFIRPGDFFWKAGEDNNIQLWAKHPGMTTEHECIVLPNGSIARFLFHCHPLNDMPDYRIHWFPTVALSADTIAFNVEHDWMNPGNSLNNATSGWGTAGGAFTVSAFTHQVTAQNLYAGSVPSDNDRKGHLSALADGLLLMAIDIDTFPGSADIGILGVEVY